jgi:hypothetical protein
MRRVKIGATSTALFAAHDAAISTSAIASYTSSPNNSCLIPQTSLVALILSVLLLLICPAVSLSMA